MAEANCQEYTAEDLKAVDEEVEYSENVRHVRDLFHERASLLYHDILDAMHVDKDDNDGGQSQVSSPRSDLAMCSLREDLSERHSKLAEHAALLMQRVPTTTQDVESRMYMVNTGLQQLNEGKQQSAANNAKDSGCIASLREWLIEMETSLDSVVLQNIDWESLQQMQALLVKHKELEVNIQSQGSAFIHQASRFVEKTEREGKGKRRRLLFESLRRRFHSLCIRVIERSCWLEQRTIHISKDFTRNIDGDVICDSEEPHRKRLKLIEEEFVDDSCSQYSDTVPFHPDEYERIIDMENIDSNGNPLDPESPVVSDLQGKHTNLIKADSKDFAQQDIGYSSGENSVHEGLDMMSSYGPGRGLETLKESLGQEVHELHDRTASPKSNRSSPCMQRRLRIESSPYKLYYKIAPFDETGLTDTDTPRPTEHEINGDTLFVYQSHECGPDSSSMLAHMDEKSHDRSFHEVMSLMDESDKVPSARSVDGSAFSEKLRSLPNFDDNQFQTHWKTFGGRKMGNIRKQSEKGGDVADDDVESCDASAEMSDVDHQERLNSVNDCQLPIMTPVPPLYASPQHMRHTPTYTSTPTGSLTRPRRRKKDHHRLSNPCVSESALLNMSARFIDESMTSYASTLGSQSSTMTSSWAYGPRFDGGAFHLLDRMSESSYIPTNRRKLRARRREANENSLTLPRSSSYQGNLMGDENRDEPDSLNLPDIQTSNLTINTNCSSSLKQPSPPNASPENQSDTQDCGHNLDTVCQFQDTGAGEGLTDRMDESEAAEQSEAYEWDDYKPGKHNECGKVDPQLDDSCVTAFGDDYYQFMEHNVENRHDSDSSESEQDEILDILKTKLQAYKKLIKDRKCNERMKMEAKLFLDYLMIKAGKLPTNNNDGTRHVIKDLLMQWRRLMSNSEVSIRTSENEEDVVMNKIKLLMEDVAQSSRDPCRRMSLDGYNNTQQISNDIQHFTDLYDNLNAHRLQMKVFRECLKGNKHGAQSLDVTKSLSHVLDDAVTDCASKLQELTKLKRCWISREDTLSTLATMLTNLTNKVVGLEQFANNKSHEESPFNIKTVFEELHLCQDRLNSLDTVFNSLTDNNRRPSPLPTNSNLEKLTAQLQDLQQRFCALPVAMECCALNDVNNGRQRSWSNTIKRRRNKPKTQRKVSVSAKSESWRELIGYWWSLPVGLLVLIGLALFCTQSHCNYATNNWRWSWGPQLDYVRGPPPS